MVLTRAGLLPSAGWGSPAIPGRRELRMMFELENRVFLPQN